MFVVCLFVCLISGFQPSKATERPFSCIVMSTFKLMWTFGRRWYVASTASTNFVYSAVRYPVLPYLKLRVYSFPIDERSIRIFDIFQSFRYRTCNLFSLLEAMILYDYCIQIMSWMEIFVLKICELNSKMKFNPKQSIYQFLCPAPSLHCKINILIRMVIWSWYFMGVMPLNCILTRCQTVTKFSHLFGLLLTILSLNIN